MSLKLRLNLIITLFLFIIMLVGLVLNMMNARQNVRAEVESTEKLALYLLDTGVLNNSNAALQIADKKLLRLQSLKHMRHVRIEFYDLSGKLTDSNQADDVKKNDSAPDWFKNIMARVTPPWLPLQRDIEYQGVLLGKLIITPDPTYEYAEIWKQITDLFLLLSVFFITINLMIAWAVDQALKPTSKILNALNHLERGDLSARLPHFDLPELAQIGLKFNHMVQTLEVTITRNHKLSQQLITLQEAERKSLARDLHDEFGQCLTAIHVDATVVAQMAESKYPELLDSAQAIVKLSRHLMDLVRGLLERLRPSILDELGLVLAIQDLVEGWKMRHEQIQCHLQIASEVPASLDESIQVTIYRMVQECLTNISRHSSASQVNISLAMQDAAGFSPSVQVEVSDNGKGFNIQQLNGFGLLGMRERIEGLGGELSLHSSLGNGAIISAILPLGKMSQLKIAGELA